jgi:hypothetical protein
MMEALMRYGRIHYLFFAAMLAGLILLSGSASAMGYTSACGVASQGAPPSIRGYFDGMKGTALAEFQGQGQPDSGAIPAFPVGTEPTQAGGVKSVKKAFLYSLVLPGAGQIYTGSKLKGALFLALEAASWVGYFSFQSKGDSKTDEFNLFADTYWSQARYEDFLAINWGVRDDDSVFQDPGDPSSGYFFTHHLPDTKTQQYNEMIGKYNQFVFGWADVTPLDAPDPDATEHTTSAMRLHYMDMRHDANVAYDRATASLMVMMVNHLASAFEAALSAKRHNNRLSGDGGGLSFRAVKARSGGEQYPMVTMRYRF